MKNGGERDRAGTLSYDDFVGNLSASEIAVILVIGLLLFGAKLPQVGRSLGKALTEFKRGLKGVEEDFEKAQRDADLELDEEERKKHAPPPGPPPALPEAPRIEEAPRTEAAPAGHVEPPRVEAPHIEPPRIAPPPA